MALLVTLIATSGPGPTLASEPGRAGGPLDDPLPSRWASEILQSSRFEIVNQANQQLPLTGRTLTTYKLLDPATGEFRRLTIDATGTVVDRDRLVEAEHAAYRAQYAKVQPRLHDELRRLDANETVPIVVWLNSDRSPPQVPGALESNASRVNMSLDTGLVAPPDAEVVPEPEDRDARRRRNLERTAAAYANLSEPVVETIEHAGGTVTTVGHTAPVIAADATREAVSALNRSPAVNTIYWAGSKPELAQNSGAATIEAPTVWDRGPTGSGAQVAVIEFGCVQFDNPYLADGLTYNLAQCAETDTEDSTGVFTVAGSLGLNEHATAAGGVIASTHGTYRGIAPDAPSLLSANCGTLDNCTQEEVIAATDWAVTNGAEVLSLSMTWDSDDNEIKWPDRYFDHQVWNNELTVDVAAGNDCGGNSDENCDVRSPALGFNVIAVGAIDDKNTGGRDDWGDDEIASYSSYVDPVSDEGDREEPDVAAVGSLMRMLDDDDDSWIHDHTHQGTSFAAPQVAGEVALMWDRDDTLTTMPEATRATVMMGAVHNVEGDATLSEKDGAGAVSAREADDVVADGTWGQWTDLQESDFPITVDLGHIPEYHRPRVAIAWPSHPPVGTPPLTDPLESDLDLDIYDSDGKRVTYSASADNSYEVVQWTVPSGGESYEAEISAFRFDGDSERLGFAWHLV